MALMGFMIAAWILASFLAGLITDGRSVGPPSTADALDDTTWHNEPSSVDAVPDDEGRPLMGVSPSSSPTSRS